VPEAPFERSHSRYGEHYVLSVDPGIGLFLNEQATLHLPFLPQLNEYFGREVFHMWNAARAEPDSLGIVTSVTTPTMNLTSASVAELIAQIMNVAGIKAKASKSGLVASNLIRQMGDLNACKVFKIRGVRKLIEDWRPDQSFNRACAKQAILGSKTSRPLSSYTDLLLGRSKLSPNVVLSRLLDRGVFRAGLDFECPNCRQTFWISLDHAKTQAECEFCGHIFNCSPQLKDKDWAFRRSGLFGRNDHQEGALPVALALQQLVGIGTFDHAIYSTAMDLEPAGADVEPCETDFVIVAQHPRRGIELAIGECKTRQPITEVDVRKLKKVADAFPKDTFSVFIAFAKLAPFTDQEIELIRSLNERHLYRAIMLTEADMETWRPYSRAEETHEFQSTVISLEDMAAATNAIFFEDRRKPVS
jgi:ribosomal protein S27E